MNKKYLVPVVLILSAGVFALTRPQKMTQPSDLRDAVGDEQSAIEQLLANKTASSVDLPQSPKSEPVSPELKSPDFSTAVGKEIILQGKIPEGRKMKAFVIYDAHPTKDEKHLPACWELPKHHAYFTTPLGDVGLPWEVSNTEARYHPKAKSTYIEPVYAENGMYKVNVPLVNTADSCFYALSSVLVTLDDIPRPKGQVSPLGVDIYFGATGENVAARVVNIDNALGVTYKCDGDLSVKDCEFVSGNPKPVPADARFIQRYANLADVQSKVYTINITK